ncbi:sensor histidine kinase [Alkalihalobacillus pseudalcaliphilus]|uniref:sensor histidine kinase n=1 Tax=Alkalihalobacillus pseudalcaliphilus TaxID=79884 RepID=UPI00064DEE57|nr:sensor histidine kinase [Alkalihalobacillus pseudalcaliphilus]KMK75113.1 histidine kinase [Alkalihalobacillus pseudalcaliphilus]
MFELLLIMLERLGLIVMLAFIATRLHFFKDMLIYPTQLSQRQQMKAILFFSVFGIIGTYSGVAFGSHNSELVVYFTELSEEEAIANFRVIGVVLAGLFGGYKVGIASGLIAGGHRMLLGGFTGFACGIATIFAGVISAYYAKRNPKATSQPRTIFLLGAFAETTQMALIVILAHPTTLAIELVKVIGVPMIVANGIGCMLFFLIIRNVQHTEQKLGALQAQKSLRIAKQTLAFLKDGLNHHSSAEVCTIIYNELKVAGVAMTDHHKILAHIGLASDHHKANLPIQTQITWEAIRRKEMVIANDKSIHCNESNCPLGAAVIAPLFIRNEVAGTLKFYFHSEKEITPLETEMLAGLTNLLSSQLELAEADRSYQLAKEAEINALQAQISPHFLFNTLNTVISLIRMNPNKARQMLHHLSLFLRQNVTSTTTNLHSIEDELNHVKSYLSIEETRFEDRFTITYDIDSSCLLTKIPPLTLQPIVENSVKHGFKDKEGDCYLRISIKDQGKTVQLTVSDNGKGFAMIEKNWLGKKIAEETTGTGIGLFNINKRLQMQFGEKASLQINSDVHQGTTIAFTIPKKKERD